MAAISGQTTNAINRTDDFNVDGSVGKTSVEKTADLSEILQQTNYLSQGARGVVFSASALLRGRSAFFLSSDYEQKTAKECSENQALQTPTYEYTTTPKVKKIAKSIFPRIASYMRWLGGKIIIPSSFWYSTGKITQMRKTSLPEDPFKYKRITVSVNGKLVDAMMIVTESTADNGRWILGSTGNAGFYEQEKSLKTTRLKQLAEKLGSNILVFNYPGVGGSEEDSNEKEIANTYEGMLHYLEDKDKGIGASTVIGYGFSLGGGAQGEGLESHALKSDIKYLFIKDRTFSDLSKAASGIFKPLGSLVKFIHRNMETLSSSKKLTAHEIILQTANVNKAQEINDSNLLVDSDGVIRKKASLAYGILEDENKDKLLKNKTILGIPERHGKMIFSEPTLDAITKKALEILGS